MNGLGGDGFWLVREPGGRIHAIDLRGGGRARHHQALPGQGLRRRSAARSRFRSHGRRRRRRMGPGARTRPRPWRPDASTSCCPTRSATLARDMPSPAPRHASRRARRRRSMPSPGLRSLPDRGQHVGRTVRQVPRLAGTLGQLAHAGLIDFYRGDVGARSRPTWSGSRRPSCAGTWRPTAPAWSSPWSCAWVTPRSTTFRRRRRA